MPINTFRGYFNNFNFVIGANTFFSNYNPAAMSAITATIITLVAIGAIIISYYIVRSQ